MGCPEMFHMPEICIVADSRTVKILWQYRIMQAGIVTYFRTLEKTGALTRLGISGGPPAPDIVHLGA